MQCIYCLKRDGVGREHYLPQCLGRFDNFQPLLNKICDTCNEPIKQIEQEFCRRSPQAALRRIFWVRDKAKKRGLNTAYFQPVQPGGQHMELVIKDPETGEMLSWQTGDKPGTISETSQIIVGLGDGRSVRIQIPLTINSGALMGMYLKSIGVGQIDRAYLCAAKGDEDRVQRVFAEMGWNGELVRRAAGPIAGEVQLRALISRQYARAIAKIAFHYALKFIPTLIGDEAEFEVLRDFILRGVGNADEIVVQAGVDGNVCAKGHLLDVRAPFQGEIEVGVKFFTGFEEHDCSTWLVHLGRNPSRLLGVTRATRHFTYRRSESGHLVGGAILDLN